MKICLACQESNHDAAERCLLCDAPLPLAPRLADQSGERLGLRDAPSPPPGTLALAVYHDAEPRVVGWLPLRGDLCLLGREDPARGLFPELDLAPLAARGVSASHASRRHALLLRRPEGLRLRVMPQTTGTQLNQALVPDGEEVPIAPGDRLILGGRVRLKLVLS
jgi:hypothetical protein